MNGRHGLERIDQELLAALNGERQAEMREAARNANLLGDGRPGDQAAKAQLRHHVLVAICAGVPVILLVARAVAAAANGGAGGGPIHLAF